MTRQLQRRRRNSPAAAQIALEPGSPEHVALAFLVRILGTTAENISMHVQQLGAWRPGDSIERILSRRLRKAGLVRYESSVKCWFATEQGIARIQALKPEPSRLLVTVDATTTHLRELTPGDEPVYYGYHRPQPKTLCGMGVGWDTHIPVKAVRCKTCRELAGLGPLANGDPA